MESETVSIAEIKKRILSSFMSLTLRQLFLRAISFGAINLILAKILPVETLGIFNIGTAIITFFAFFSDIGLAASLIQKKDSVTQSDIRTTFTIQQLIVGVLSLIIIVGAPYYANFYQLNSDGVWLIRILGFSFFLSSLKVIPSVLLERELKFQPLVIVEVVETLIFNGILIFLAFSNFGIWSFSVAALVRGLSGVLLIYILAPVKVGLGVEKTVLKKLLSFGIPFQVNNLLALLKDRLVPLVVARMVGPLGIGYVTWAQSMAFLPLEIMNIMIRITFPAFSRLQHDKKILAKAVEKSLFATSLFTYPALFGLGAVLPAVVTYVVSSKWGPAVPSFYMFAFSTFWAVISTTFTNVLNAVGYIKVTLKLMIFWTIITWVLTPILVFQYGFFGVGLSSFIISFTSVVTIILVKRILSIKLIEAIYLPVIASIVMSIVVYFFSINFVRDTFSLVVAVVMGGFIYALLILLFGREKVLNEIRSLRSA